MCARARGAVIHASVNLMKHNSLINNTVFVGVHIVGLCILVVK